MDAKQISQKRFAAVESELQTISRWMYEHPEIAFEEYETSAKLAGFLTEHGFDVEYPAYGLDTAFAARTGASGPEVIICAEYDALPGVGHACGHNIIATASLGAGIALGAIADDLGFRVTVLGTPAEEMKGGKVDLIKAGAFDSGAISMMIHPAPDDVVDPRVLAVHHIDVEYHGKDSHAAGAPEKGVNALDAFVQAYVNISTLRQQILPTDRIHGIITHGGDAPNIIPSHTASSWYIRSATKERLDELEVKVMACFEAAALSTGCTWETSEIGNPYEDLVSNRILVELFADNASRLGRNLARGADMPMAGSTDMGNVSHVVPAIHPFLSINPGDAVNHQPEFAAHTITADGDKAIHDGALAMAWTVIDVAERDLWGQVKVG